MAQRPFELAHRRTHLPADWRCPSTHPQPPIARYAEIMAALAADSNAYLIQADQLTIHERIGRGTFGTVHSGN